MSNREVILYIEDVRKGLNDDPFVRTIRRHLYNDYDVSQSNRYFKFNDGFLYYQGLLNVPSRNPRMKIHQALHDLPIAKYFGFNKTR